MSPIRKIILSGMLGLSLLAPLGFAAQAQAAPARHGESQRHHHHHTFHVYYRANCDAPWQCYGEYRSERSAQHCVRELQGRGFEAYCR